MAEQLVFGKVKLFIKLETLSGLDTYLLNHQIYDEQFCFGIVNEGVKHMVTKHVTF